MTDTSATLEHTLLNLKLSVTENDRGSADVWVETSDDAYCSSYACATNEGTLDGNHDLFELTPAHLKWLDSQTVISFLDTVGY